MRRRLMMLVGVGFVLAVFFGVWLASGSSYPRLLIGEAWILTKQVPVTVEVDGRRLEQILCFAGSRHASRRLILGVETPQRPFRYGFLIVDLDGQRVLSPNPGDRYNKVLRNGWLLQSDAGATGVDLADPVKGGEPVSDFRRSGNSVLFNIAPGGWLPAGRWNVRIGEDRRI